MTKPLPEIERCCCGKSADVVPDLWVGDATDFIECLRRNCWTGHSRKTERGAINAWSRVMRKETK